MKKILFIICFAILFLSQYEYHDLSSYQSTSKKVEVKGEVEKPGIYEVALDASIQDILQEAGGIKEGADISSLNLNQNVEQNAVIVVPLAAQMKKISINTASLEELDLLQGIGPKVAQRIIDRRMQKPFSTLEELMEVKGIGPKLFEKIKDAICL